MFVCEFPTKSSYVIEVFLLRSKFLIYASVATMNYFELGYPFIIVKKLTKEIITEAIEAYRSENAY